MTVPQVDPTVAAAGPGPVTFEAGGQPNALWWGIGLGMGLLNAVRHRLRGYRTPRPFSADEITRSVDYVIGVADRWQADGDLEFKGARILELGPGPDLGTGAVLLARGAASYTAADVFPLAEDVDPAFYAALRDRLDADVTPEALAYRVTAFPDLPDLEGPYDLVVSNAAMEHVDDVRATFARLAALVPPGGTMCHHIDGMVHMRWVRPRDPLNMLRYGDLLYRAMSFPGIPNRLRATDFKTAAEATGWSARVVPRLTAPTTYATSVRLAPRFRAAPDLTLLTFTLVCTRLP